MSLNVSRIAPITLLIVGTVLLGFSLSLQVYSQFYPKHGTLTIALNKDNNYTATQPLFFNYHGHVEIKIIDDNNNSVQVSIGQKEYVLNNTHRRESLILDGGENTLYFTSSGPVELALYVEDYLIVPGEDWLLLIIGAVLTAMGLAFTTYYVRKNVLFLE